MTHASPTRRTALALLGTLGVAGLAGCNASLLPKPPAAPALYTLDDGAAAAARPPAPAGAPGLLVAVPRAAAGLDTRLMAYQRTPQRTEHYTASEWLDTPPRLLAPLLLRALEATGAFGVVLLAPAGAATRWRLETELLRLQQNFGSVPSQLRLTLRAVLVDADTRAVLAAQTFDARMPAPSEDAAGGAAAAQRAALQVAQDLAAFCAAAAARAGG
jgi:cholesterol transport system auxiliary component